MVKSDLVNFTGVSKRLAGNITSISKKRVPKKYFKKVQEFIDYVDAFNFDIK